MNEVKNNLADDLEAVDTITQQLDGLEAIGDTIYIVGGGVIVILFILGYIVLQYNSFIKLSNIVKEAFSTMDVYMKKRWDLVPNLVEVVKGYAKHESSTLENVIKARASSSYDNMGIEDKMEINNQLAGTLKSIFAVAENYPDLKANQSFLNLSSELSQIEDEIANSRKYYNGAIKKLNTKIEMFPSNIVAKLFGFKKQKMFEATNNERVNIDVNL